MELNEQQKIAVQQENGHVLVLAGAGTGKTRTIVERAAHLIRGGIKVEEILLITFTRRAAKEMVERLNLTVGKWTYEIRAGTFHHFCLYTMRRMPRAFGIENATIIDREDQIQLMKLVRAGYIQEGENVPTASRLADIYSYARNTNQSAKKYIDTFTEYTPQITDIMLSLFSGYEKRKRSNNYLDYDDILSHFGEILHESKDIRDKIKKLYKHILVDEMQDTNPLQWLILDAIRDPAILFCVGDDAQSIYAFRGADFENIHSFKDRVPNSVVLKLEKNYRSTQEILDVSNWLLNESPLNYRKQLESYRGGGIRPKVVDFESEMEEAIWICKDIIERHNSGTCWQDCMAITRSGLASRTLEACMIEKQIPYHFIGGISLMQSAHVKDLFSLIRCAISHRDELAWVRYLTLWPRIGDKTAYRVIENMKSMDSLKLALDYLRIEAQIVNEIPNGPEILLTRWKDPSNAIREASKFLEPLLREKYNKWDVRKKDYDLLERIAATYKSLLEFLETYTLDPISTSEARKMDSEDSVTLITAHSAKGTEASVCYLIRVEPGMYPHIRSLGEFGREEEERRVLYVAMTRARDNLIITRTFSRSGQYSSRGEFRRGNSMEWAPYLLENIPIDLIDTQLNGIDGDFYADSDKIEARDNGE